jgi:hypothetical protein
MNYGRMHPFRAYAIGAIAGTLSLAVNIVATDNGMEWLGALGSLLVVFVGSFIVYVFMPKG